jgi:predicted TPR repeat methyltransferase
MRALLLNPTVLLTTTETGYLAYDTAADRLHELNPLAALLVELCDGRRTTDELLELAAPHLPEGSIQALTQWLEQAANAGLLVVAEEGRPPSSASELSAEQLDELARRLRDVGKIQAAYLCQSRADELQPHNCLRLRRLAELAHIAGKRDKAREAYELCLTLEPDDAEVRHLLTSLRDETAPQRVPSECIEQLYRRFSTFYETNMCEELNYHAPTHLAEAIAHATDHRSSLDTLDLGCGTGLSGKAVAPSTSRLIGVDLSKEMLEIAETTGIYDELHADEITTWLQKTTERFDLILACDSLIYFGDLAQVLIPAAQCLRSGGILGFSVERGQTPPFRLTDSGRYEHHEDHIRKAAEIAGLKLLSIKEHFIRMEYGQEVIGWVVVLTAPTTKFQTQLQETRLR